MKWDARKLAGFLKAPDPGCRAVLVYGDDPGAVREAAESVARTVVPDLSDPFRVAELSGEALAEDRARLADEAAALSMMGGRRVVRVRHVTAAAAAALTDTFASFLADPPGDALVVVEAGDLKPSSAFCRQFDAAKLAGSLRLFHDEGEGLEAVIRSTLAAHEVRAGADVIAWLAAHLGGDRGVTRGELAKLALYVGAGGEATLDDARAVVGDSAEIGFDDLCRAVAAGDAAGAERAYERLCAEGVPGVPVLRALQRHFQRLHLCAGLMAQGRDADAAMNALRPPVFWKERGAFRAALRRWPADQAARALDRLLQAEIACKTSGPVAGTLTAHCVLALAGAGARR